MTVPRISVVIPLFNAERYVAEAIQSALAQTLPPHEVIVVNDGSTDGSAAAVRSCGAAVRLVDRPHEGIGATRNAGIALAEGDFIALLDADDLWEPVKLQAQIDLIEADGVDGAFAHVVQFVSPDAADSSGRAEGFDAPMEGIAPSALLARRPVFERVGPMSTALQLGEFIDWHARALDAGFRFAMHADVLVRRRLHDSNTGIRERASRADYLRVLKASLDRRREAAARG